MATKNNPLPVRPDDNFGQQGKIGQARQPQAQTPNAPDDVTSQPQTPAPVVGSTNSDGETILNEEGDFTMPKHQSTYDFIQNLSPDIVGAVNQAVRDAGRAVEASRRPTSALGLRDPLANLNQKVAGQVEANQAAQAKAQKEAEEKEAERLSIRDMKEALEKQYHIESDEDRAAREKNERRAKLFASIGDGISALSDLYFSTQGAPMVHDPASGMSERLRQRYEKLDAERKANEAAYQREYLRQLEQMQRAKKEAAAAALEEKKFKLAEDREARMLEQSNLQSRKFDWQQKYQQGLLDIKQEEAQIRRDLADGLISKREAETALIELRKYRLQNTPAKGSSSNGGNSNAGSGNGGGTHRRTSGGRNTGHGSSNSSGNGGRSPYRRFSIYNN